jgi:hypothetical protein
VNPRDYSLERWANDASAEFSSLLLTTDVAFESLRGGTAAMRASADQIRAIVDSGQRKTAAHPCPDPALAVRLAGLFERYGFMARSLEASADDYGDGYIPAVAHQLQRLGADLTSFVDDLGRAIEGR